MKDNKDAVIHHDETQERINELKRNLANTDYLTLKFYEGELSKEDFEESKAQREAWREEIRQLEQGDSK